MSTDPLTLAARIASDLQQLVDQGLVSEEVQQATLAELPVQGQAKWAWEAQDTDEISFPVDALILVLKRDGEWWTGRAPDGSVGLFPHTYLTLLPYPPIPVTRPAPPPIPTRKPSHLASAAVAPAARGVFTRLPDRTLSLPPPPARSMSGTSDSTSPDDEPRDYKSAPLSAAYKPTVSERMKDKGSEVRGRIPFGGSGGAGGGGGSGTAGEKSKAQQIGSKMGDAAVRGAGWHVGGAVMRKVLF